jgi:hypothetical protein
MICLIVTAERLLWLRRMNKENRQVQRRTVSEEIDARG